MTLLELGTTPFVTVTIETVEPATAQVPDPTNRLYVTVPPALKEPVRVAESDTDFPTVTAVADRAVLMLGLAF